MNNRVVRGKIMPALVRWVRRFAIDRAKQRKADIKDKIKPTFYYDQLDPIGTFTLLDLFALGKVDVVEDEKRIERYLAVLKKNPLFVCEITKDAYETLAHTDLPEKRRIELARKGRTYLPTRNAEPLGSYL